MPTIVQTVQVLLSISSLLADPNADDPLEADVAHTYKTNRSVEYGTPYNVRARYPRQRNLHRRRPGFARSGCTRIGHACLRWAYKCCSPFHFTSRWCLDYVSTKYRLSTQFTRRARSQAKVREDGAGMDSQVCRQGSLSCGWATEPVGCNLALAMNATALRLNYRHAS